METTSQPKVLESAIRSTPRTRACRFSAASPASPRSARGARRGTSDDVLDANLLEVAAEALGQALVRRLACPSEENCDGIDTQWTRSAPKASTHRAAVTAESIPPETPTTTSAKPLFST